MNSADTSAGGEPSASQPRPIGASARTEQAVEAALPISDAAERELARWENEGGRIHA